MPVGFGATRDVLRMVCPDVRQVHTFKAKDEDESLKWLRAFMTEGSTGPSLPAEAAKPKDAGDKKKTTGKRMAVSAEAGDSSSRDYVKQYYKKTDEARAFIFSAVADSALFSGISSQVSCSPSPSPSLSPSLSTSTSPSPSPFAHRIRGKSSSTQCGRSRWNREIW
jgi:hypothetical protein